MTHHHHELLHPTTTKTTLKGPGTSRLCSGRNLENWYGRLFDQVLGEDHLVCLVLQHIRKLSTSTLTSSTFVIFCKLIDRWLSVLERLRSTTTITKSSFHLEVALMTQLPSHQDFNGRFGFPTFLVIRSSDIRYPLESRRCLCRRTTSN